MCKHHALQKMRALEQLRLNSSEIYTEAAHLDHGVGAANDHEEAARPRSAVVAGESVARSAAARG